MNAWSAHGEVVAFPFLGTPGKPLTNPLRKRMERAKRDALDEAMGKGESWSRKVLNDDVGIPLDDLPKLLALHRLKLVDEDKVCIDRKVAEAMNVMHIKLAPHVPELLWEDET